MNNPGYQNTYNIPEYIQEKINKIKEEIDYLTTENKLIKIKISEIDLEIWRIQEETNLKIWKLKAETHGLKTQSKINQQIINEKTKILTNHE